MIITDKEKDICKEFSKALDPLRDASLYSLKEIRALSILSIQIDAGRVVEKGMRPNGNVISILDLDRAFHKYHNDVKESVLKLQKLETQVMAVRSAVNKLMSENFTICHACKGRKGKEVVVDNTPDFEECNMCDGRGVLRK